MVNLHHHRKAKNCLEIRKLCDLLSLKEHTCLILHDTKGEDGSIEVTDGIAKLDREISKTAVATLQLEISEQASKIYDMKLLLKSNMEELAKV